MPTRRSMAAVRHRPTLASVRMANGSKDATIEDFINALAFLRILIIIGKHLPMFTSARDVSSPCDHSTDFQRVQSMNFFPFGAQNRAFLAGSISVPMLPLLLIEVPTGNLPIQIGGALL